MVNRFAYWFKSILKFVIESKAAIVHITGTIDNMDSYRERTGYRRFFMIRWIELFEKEIQHHEMPVNAWNEVARQVKEDGYKDGDIVSIIAKLKTHKGERDMYLELLDIRHDMD